ncbi:thioredoxin domain-containing protein [Paenibacillus typhae]|uniref:Protein-disulfide isomerase n=1 Tax=Paenibacillus typhae TaxID=1174501 RepID=A0A1G8URQ4_9BACL|nr:thioredoxin domain-containing protein [Paenibacillus typhae]SDJ56478.1 Protein-disulfide isomerase [Paenibacillus typhae]
MTKREFRSRTSYYIITLLAISVILLLTVIIFNNNSSKISALEEMPNYTEIKGTYNVEGLKYEKQPHLGKSDAKVKIVEFADFKCPACKKWKELNWSKLKKEFIDTGKAELFFINYAFIDRDSILAASAGEAIANQSNSIFWDFYDKLYDQQGDETQIWATQDFLLKFVKENISGIDYSLFEKNFKAHEYMLDVKEDYKTAGHFGVNGTPQFMVNGELLLDSSYETLAEAIETQLAVK